MQVYPGIINAKNFEALSFQHFSLNPVGYCSDHTQVNLISDLIFLSFTSKIVREKRAVAEELLIQLTWSSCIKTPGLDGLLCISLSEKKVENSPLECFGPSWLSNVKYKQPFPHKWGFIMWKIGPFILHFQCLLCQELGPLIC